MVINEWLKCHVPHLLRSPWGTSNPSLHSLLLSPRQLQTPTQLQHSLTNDSSGPRRYNLWATPWTKAPGHTCRQTSLLQFTYNSGPSCWTSCLQWFGISATGLPSVPLLLPLSSLDTVFWACPQKPSPIPASFIPTLQVGFQRRPSLPSIVNNQAWPGNTLKSTT